MNKVKLRFITILSFFLLFVLAFGSAVLLLDKSAVTASATSYKTTEIFSQGTGGDILAYKESDGETAYTTLVLTDGGNVYYRRNLALKWFEAKEDENSALANPGEAHAFSLEFKFVSPLNFETFTLTFESTEENVTKEGKSTNSITFTNKDGAITATVKNSAEEENSPVTLVVSEWQKLTLVEGEDIGEYDVAINENQIGTFTNIGGNYLEYRSSASSTPNTPMTFEVKMAEGAAEGATAKVLLKELNGQTLEVTGGTSAETAEPDGTTRVSDGAVVDDTAAALVLNEEVYAFTLGQKFSLSYEAIDVCDDSVTVTRQYYMLKKDDENGYVKGGDDDYSTLTTSTYFLPTANFGEDEEEIIYVSIRFKLDDGRSVDSDDEKLVYLSWYATSSAVKTLGEEENEFDYIVVDRDKEGPQYVGLTVENEANVIDESVYNAAVEAYQAAVDNAAKDISAGSGAYFYLPSLRGLITSDYADYRNLKFSVYFYTQTQTDSDSASSATSLGYNALKFEIATEGTYKFRILAADASGNAMKYYYEGALVSVSSSNIWEIDEIPEFTFYAKYTGATIEDSGEQALGYRDTNYSITSFEVIALDGIEKEYTLYYFDESKLPEGVTVPSYSEFVADTAKYLELYADYLTVINKYDEDIKEDTDEWENSDNAYSWDPDSSLSFTPQKSGFYVVELLVTDSNRSNEQTLGYQVIEVRNPFDYTPGVSTWLADNVVSVVLFGISAVLLVVIVVLLIVKPSDKKVEEVDLKKLKGKKKSK